MDVLKFEQLLKKHKDGSITDPERLQLDALFNEYARSCDDPSITLEEVELRQKKGRQKAMVILGLANNKSYWYKISAVAALFIIGLTLFFYFWVQPNMAHPMPSAWVSQIPPGGNHAILTLPTGEKVSLNSMPTGSTVAGIHAQKTDEGTIKFDDSSEVNSANALTTITTPKGGQFHIILSDGTNVWLNAATSIALPISFANTGSRFVRLLAGEAYFEVAKDHKRPFIVATASQQVKVLGTHFNINAYPDELGVSTTLLEGSVQLISTLATDSKLTLIPGQQAKFQNNRFETRQVNDDIIAWTNGKIKFKKEPLAVIMRQLSRWYNVELAYEGPPRDREFTGVINRTYSLNTVIEILNGMGIESRLENREGRPFLVIKN